MSGAVSMLDPICPTRWQGQPIPQRRWLIPGFLIRGTVTMLSGDGGVGKSLLAQQLATALAIGAPFLGLQAQPGPVPSLALFCEDDADELQFRQARINAHYGCDMADLGAMTILSRVGQDNGLMSFDRRTDEGEASALYHQLEHLVRQSGAELIVIDTSADTFMGNENIRPQVRQFIGALRRLAMINDGGVILNAHPSLTGLNSGSGLSGSTAWNNSVRGRLYLTRPPTIDGEEEQSDARILKLMKSNYGPTGEQIRLAWHEHVFVREDHAGGANAVDRMELDNAVYAGLRKLVENGVRIPADPQAKNGLAVRLRDQPAYRRWHWRAINAAQERLIAAGKVVKVEMGPPSRRRLFVRPHDMTLPGEA